MFDKEILVKFDKISSGYGKKVIIKDFSVEIHQRSVTTLIGRNGVGKTTLLNTLMGLINPFNGKIFYGDKNITSISPYDLVKMGISYVPQGKSVFPHMTVSEHLDIGSCTIKDKKNKALMIDFACTLFPRLKERANQKAGTLSGGERQMLSIARALMSRPKLLLLDEPSFGLAPIMVDAVFKSIQDINKNDVTIFVVEQNAKKAIENSDYCFVMDMGKIIKQGKSKILINDENIKKDYLGGLKLHHEYTNNKS